MFARTHDGGGKRYLRHWYNSLDGWITPPALGGGLKPQKRRWADKLQHGLHGYWIGYGNPPSGIPYGMGDV